MSKVRLMDPLLHNVPIVDAGGRPTAQFSRLWMQARGVDIAVGGLETGLNDHAAATTGVHGIADTGSLILEGDARLTDARTPLPHVASHYTGADALSLDLIPGTLPLASIAQGATGQVLLGATGAAPAYGQIADAHIDNAAAIAWTKLSKAGSSLADLAVRSAADLVSGHLAAARLPTGALTWDTGLTGGFSNDITVPNGVRLATASGVSAFVAIGTLSGTAGAKLHVASTSAAQGIYQRQNNTNNVSVIFRTTSAADVSSDVYIGQGNVGEFAVGTGADLRTVGFRVTSSNGNTRMAQALITGAIDHDGTTLGLLGAAPVARQVLTGSRGGNAALQSVISALVAYGLATDTTTV